MRVKLPGVPSPLSKRGFMGPGANGFGVRARGGGKFYVFKFRAHGKQRWHTIGRHGSPWTPEEARKEAKRLLGELATGRAPADKAQVTVADLSTVSGSPLHASALGLPNGLPAAQARRPPMGQQKVASITHRDVVELSMRYRATTGRDAPNREPGTRRTQPLLQVGDQRGHVPVTREPGRRHGTQARRGAERARVDEREIGRVWAAAGDFPYGAIIRLLLATGQRRNEVGGMRWSEFDLERVWRLPKERTKAAGIISYR